MSNFRLSIERQLKWEKDKKCRWNKKGRKKVREKNVKRFKKEEKKIYVSNVKLMYRGTVASDVWEEDAKSNGPSPTRDWGKVMYQ